MSETAMVLMSGDNLPATSPAMVYLASLAPTGRASMTSSLRTVAQLLGFDDWQAVPWHLLRYEHLQAIRTKLAETYAPASTNRMLTAVKRVMREAFALRLIDAEALERIRLVKRMTGSRLPAGRALGPGELAAMLRECANDDSPVGVRDAAIIALAYGGGLRRKELADLQIDNLTVPEDPEQPIDIKLVGKRNKERTCYLDNGAADAMRDWLSIRGDEPGPVFWSGKRGGHLVPRDDQGQRRGMSPQAIRDVIVRRAQAADVQATPHDLRRSFITDMLEANVDPLTVADIVGHDDINTTRKYDRRGEHAKRKAVKALHVPYVSRRLA